MRKHCFHHLAYILQGNRHDCSGATSSCGCWMDRRYLNIIRSLLSSHVLLRNDELQPFPLAADEGLERRAADVHEQKERRDWPPLNLRDLLARADETAIARPALTILQDWLHPAALASGLPGRPLRATTRYVHPLRFFET